MTPAEIRRTILALRGLPELPQYVHCVLRTDPADHLFQRIKPMLHDDPELCAALTRIVLAPGGEAGRAHRMRLAVWQRALLQLFPLEAPGLQERQAFWRHAFAAASLAHQLSSRPEGEDPATACAAVLLHDVGKLVLEQLLPREYARAVELVRSQGLFILEAERRETGVDHTLAGKWLAEAWGLPDTVVNAIWLHHQPPSLLTAAYPQNLIHLTALSALLARHKLLHPPTARFTAAIEERRKRLGLAAEVLQQAVPAPAPWEAPQETPVSHRQDPATPGVAALERELRRIEGLYRLAKALGPCRNTAQALEVLVTVLRKTFAFSAGMCLLHDTEAQEYSGKAWKSLDGSFEELHVSVSEAKGRRSRAFTLLRRVLRASGGEAAVPEDGLLVLPLQGQDGLSGQLIAETGAAGGADPDQLQEVLDFLQVGMTGLSRCWQAERGAQRQESLCATLWRQELQHQQTLKTERLASVTKLAAGAAHEINNPLAIISGQAQILLSRAQHPGEMRALEQIVQQTRRAGKVVLDLLQFARPPAPRLESGDLSAVLQRALAQVKARLDAAGIKVVEDYGRLLPRVLLDQEQMEQVLVQLLGNAAQAMSGGGTLTLRLRATRDRKSLVLQLSDTGPGILPEHMNQVFEPFFSQWEHGRGAGLGLPLCHGIVEAHRGAIALHSQPGEGATCIITLPAAAESVESLTPAPERKPEVRSFTVLLADRQEELREVLQEALAARGMGVRVAGDSLEAMAVLMGHAVDAVLLDLQMYTPRGLPLLRQIRERYPNVPIVALSLGNAEENADALAAGAAACLQKPFRLEQLLQELERVIGRRNVA